MSDRKPRKRRTEGERLEASTKEHDRLQERASSELREKFRKTNIDYKKPRSEGQKLGFRASAVPVPEEILETHTEFKERLDKRAPTVVESMTEYSVSSSNFLRDIIDNDEKDTSFLTIKRKIKRELTVKRSQEASAKNILREGATMFHELILKKLIKLSEEDEDIINERMDFFFEKEGFIEKFMNDIPEGTYAPFFNELFGVKSALWRTSYLSTGENNAQCVQTIGHPAVGALCYLCNDRMNADKECEHLLPIGEALMHFWLMQDRSFSHLTSESKELLKREYAWAHGCCNKQKGYSLLIKRVIDSELVRYESNRAAIMKVLYKIIEGRCGRITDIETQAARVRNVFQPLVETINATIAGIGSKYYPLYIKYKLISAISDNNFEKIILGKVSGGGLKDLHVNPIDALANILRSEYLDKKIIKDIDGYNAEIDKTPLEYYIPEPINESSHSKKELRRTVRKPSHIKTGMNNSTRHGGKRRRKTH